MNSKGVWATGCTRVWATCLTDVVRECVHILNAWTSGCTSRGTAPCRPKATSRFSRIFFKSNSFFTPRLGSSSYSAQFPLLRNRGAVLEIAEVSHKLSNGCYGAETK